MTEELRSVAKTLGEPTPEQVAAYMKDLEEFKKLPAKYTAKDCIIDIPGDDDWSIEFAKKVMRGEVRLEDD